MNVIDTPQRSSEWFEARRGIPTASRFDQILTALEMKTAAAQQTLIDELIAESVLPPQEGVIMTEDMYAGLKLEGEARCAYDLDHAEAPMSEIGFVMHDSGLFGGSPDALVGEDGGVEIKCPAPHTHVGYVRKGILPLKYKAQVHGSLIVTGRKWWDFFCYSRHFPPLRVRVTPDEFTAKLEAELYRFCARYNEARALFGLPPIGQQKAA